MKKMFIAGVIALIVPFAAFAQSTITGTLSSNGVVTTSGSGSSTLTGTVSTSSTGSLSGTVGGGSGILTGTVTSPSTGTTGGGGGGGGGSNGPPAGGGGGGGGSGTVVVCPNLPDSLYTLPSGYEVIDGNCDPIGTTSGGGTTGTTGPSVPGIPNTGEGGFALLNLTELLLSGALAAAGYRLFRST